jgi:uncharacterized protein YdbL (DUF1318 family)
MNCNSVARQLWTALWVLLYAVVPLSSQVALAQFTQQGPKLVGTGAVGQSAQGFSVALSADGSTAILGGIEDNSYSGAAWVYSCRSQDHLWTQQGSKLVGTGAVGDAQHGYSIALSSDGNTAIVGARADNSNTGAVWVYTRSSNGLWTQQGSKLVGTGAVGKSTQGWSVALSGDGNTALVGGPADNSNTGVVWVYTRTDSVWTQQGIDLVGTGAVGSADQGWSVALSGDGNTAIVGGLLDSDGYPGAAWVYTRNSKGLWIQQGSKLVGTGAVGQSQQGYSVALSSDGNTAIVGGPLDSFVTDIGSAGAVWVYTRSRKGLWTQLGSKLVGTAAVGLASQGQSIALSGEGDTVLVGGPADNSDAGAAWVFVHLTKDDCKHGGWLNFIGPPRRFTSEVQCVGHFEKLK